MRSFPKPDITPLFAALDKFHPLSPPIKDFLKQHVFAIRADKGDLLLKAGSLCENVYFILSGLLRGHIIDGNKDITTWISCEYEMVTSIYSLDSYTPALENIEAIEDCELLVLKTVHLQELYDDYPDFNIVGRKLLQQYYRAAECRAFISRVNRAEDKYEHFLKLYSHLSNRVLLKYIASFLGITFETLSRVRSRYSSRRKAAVTV
jgi:CRP-like cAMP-binding protein